MFYLLFCFLLFLLFFFVELFTFKFWLADRVKISLLWFTVKGFSRMFFFFLFLFLLPFFRMFPRTVRQQTSFGSWTNKTDSPAAVPTRSRTLQADGIFTTSFEGFQLCYGNISHIKKKQGRETYFLFSFSFFHSFILLNVCEWCSRLCLIHPTRYTSQYTTQ